MKSSTTITYKGAELEVEFYCTPGDPGVYTYSNGDPGYPPTPPEFEIHKIEFTGKDHTGKYHTIDVTEMYDDTDFEQIEELIEERSYCL